MPLGLGSFTKIQSAIPKPRPNHRLAALLCAFVAGAYITAGVFVSSHAHHDCIGEGCEVCAQVHIVMLSLANGSIAAGAALLAARFAAVPAIVAPHVRGGSAATPVTSRVRLNY
ncbi:MAG: hypothetical protein LBH39_08660 [Clostridiales Family XIII bacterium]|jgi:hypothetical protein|nr:hypothetical protein [Clostridiales Family XIII bacterium]